MLRICLEPEAASICVQYLQIEKEQNGFTMTKTGTKYMVVDIGGGCSFFFITYVAIFAREYCGPYINVSNF